MEWIKIKDRLPAPGIKILFLEDKVMYPDNCYTGVYYGDGVWHKSDCPIRSYNVTHWCSIPNKPHQPKLTWQYELKSEPGVWKDATDDEHEAGCDLIRLNWRQIEK